MSDGRIADYLNLVSEDRKSKTAGYLRTKDRARSLAAGLLVKYAERKVGSDVVYSPLGKPMFANRSDRHLSISHSGDYAVCAVSGFPVGADIEKTEDPISGMGEYMFSPGEIEELFRYVGDERERMCYRKWTLKESYMKAVGEGLFRNPTSFSIPGIGETGPADPKRPSEKWYFCVSEDLNGYVISVCS